MIPFANTWPYETIGQDIYVQECPFCQSSNVMLRMKKEELQEIREGRKKLLIFPCCHNKMTVIDNDSDYLLGDRPIRSKRK